MMLHKKLLISVMVMAPVITTPSSAVAGGAPLGFDACVAGCIASRPGNGDWCVSQCLLQYPNGRSSAAAADRLYTRGPEGGAA